MNKIKVVLKEVALTDADINEFETNFNIKLPDNYKKLIKKYNGGLVKEVQDVKILRSIKYGPHTVESFMDVHQNLEDNISKDLLSIAADVSGNPICINVKQGDDNYGKVYIIYMDGGDLEPVLMANSLEELFGVKKIEDL